MVSDKKTSANRAQLLNDYDEGLAKDIMQALYCRNCGNEDLRVDARLTDLLCVKYRCYCTDCGTKGEAAYSFEPDHAALESRSIGIKNVRGGEVLEP